MSPNLVQQFPAALNGVYAAPAAPQNLSAAARGQGLVWATLDLAGVTTKKGFLAACAHALQFPAGLGGNWDALADCLEDLSWLPPAGVVVHWCNGGPFAAGRAADVALALEIFEAAARFWTGHQRTFVVLIDAGCGGGRVLPGLAQR